MPTALITGVTGQDGSYLAQELLEQGYNVWGMVRGQDNPRAHWLQSVSPDVNLVTGDLTDELSLYSAVAKTQPDEVYNFAAISSPGLAWGQPILTAQVTGLGALRLFEAVFRTAPEARVVQASSLALHGPYGAAKTYAHTIAADYRERGLHISCAIFGGHHSPRRGRSFLARKVTSAVAEIVNGTRKNLTLGSLTRLQDWGWAPDFMRQMPTVASLPPDNYVMSTGVPYTAQQWVETAFRLMNMDWRSYVHQDLGVGNVTDVAAITSPPDPRLNWTPKIEFEALIKWMIEADLR